eukprot:Seg1040.3 transcript_id=Seg1040.3/GoldUCD/mRNA.D3Y31 product="hypothetical protein" protein_id=Seg1040.3/GoldUCD/D3Y31
MEIWRRVHPINILKILSSTFHDLERVASDDITFEDPSCEFDEELDSDWLELRDDSFVQIPCDSGLLLDIDVEMENMDASGNESMEITDAINLSGIHSIQHDIL